MTQNRMENWQTFSRHMEEYIRDRTIEKYSTDGTEETDLMGITNSAIICVWNILKYAFRIWKRRMKRHDLEKIVHYAEMAWTLSKGELIGNDLSGREAAQQEVSRLATE
jgi:hypothetical protein